MISKLSGLVMDCADAEGQATFWAKVLGWQRTYDGDGEASIGSEDGSQSLFFQQVAEPKTVKNRLHIDLSPLDRDQDAELARLLELGARRVDVGQPADAAWIVLADPEGNEFCLLRDRAQ